MLVSCGFHLCVFLSLGTISLPLADLLWKLLVVHSQQSILISHLPCPPTPAGDMNRLPTVETVITVLVVGGGFRGCQEHLPHLIDISLELLQH